MSSEEKDLECTNRLMVVILGNRLTKTRNAKNLGKMGIAVSPVNSNRLYALIENTKVDCIDLMMQGTLGID
jgi:hypothetical protein